MLTEVPLSNDETTPFGDWNASEGEEAKPRTEREGVG